MNGAPLVLYIDDDEALRRLAQRALERRGYRVLLASGGLEGVGLAAETAFDLVAVDHFMPGYDGLATLELLRALPQPPPVVYVTGSEESRIAVAALKAGAADYVVKTVGDDFFDLLDSAFRQALASVRLGKDKEAAEASLRASNDRLQAMLSEVNHRVANSLQLVSAFVHMQAAAVADPAAKAALEDTQQRIAAIAHVHQRLYTSEAVDTVDMRDYLTALVGELEQTWSTPASRRTLSLDAEPVRVKTDRTVAVGIIVTELVSNACKYAYAAGQPGEVRVILKAEADDRFRLTVQDDGPGIRPDEGPKGTGLGSKLIAVMAKSLESSVTMETGHGGVSATLRAHC
ncbi:MAG TPA: histidine kinase dimerization/phosphoacceptor domain -containing protein [Caulobacteraceae bacterium]